MHGIWLVPIVEALNLHNDLKDVLNCRGVYTDNMAGYQCHGFVV